MIQNTEGVAASTPDTHTQVGNQKTDAGAIHAVAADAAVRQKTSARRRATTTTAS